MNKIKNMNKIIATIIIIVIVVGAYYLMSQSILAPEDGRVSEEEQDIAEECSEDDNCIVFGETGDCNCGCYHKDNLPSETGGECFCVAPDSCECINSKCEGVFKDNPEDINSFDECTRAGYPVLESYPRQCKTENDQTFTEENCVDSESKSILTLADAKQIAIESECGDVLKDTYVCNENTGTYWIDLNIEKPGCVPACVVDIITREAVINWRCTGLIE